MIACSGISLPPERRFCPEPMIATNKKDKIKSERISIVWGNISNCKKPSNENIQVLKMDFTIRRLQSYNIDNRKRIRRAPWPCVGCGGNLDGSEITTHRAIAEFDLVGKNCHRIVGVDPNLLDGRRPYPGYLSA